MAWLFESPLDDVRRSRDGLDRGADARRTRKGVAEGALVRVSRGSYVPAADWLRLSDIARHAQRVWEAAARMAPGAVFSHSSAAAVLGIDRLGGWPEVIDVSGEAIGGSSGVIRRHRRGVATTELMPWGDHFITAPARTAVDLAASSGFLAGVVAADQALWTRRRGGALTTPALLSDAARSYDGRASATVLRASAFGRGGADSVRESHSRVLIAHLGFPDPVLQQRFRLSTGFAYTDFWWPEHRHAGEFDGTGKYLDPQLLRGRSPQQALIAEKDRGDELRRQVRALSRWRTPSLERPRLLYDILTADGLPSTRGRPGR
ncbi:hypothetical protein [Microbacterium sulfonylureivorans]|uniref:hypothetical protein n=1 Tax=Microbacterium sulfonylureivorans TaxID=2486854 RepID=UPI000FDB5DC4|nr:hypothetical protein [Microbacterium sulfonylureivorans]